MFRTFLRYSQYMTILLLVRISWSSPLTKIKKIKTGSRLKFVELFRISLASRKRLQLELFMMRLIKTEHVPEMFGLFREKGDPLSLHKDLYVTPLINHNSKSSSMDASWSGEDFTTMYGWTLISNGVNKLVFLFFTFLFFFSVSFLFRYSIYLRLFFSYFLFSPFSVFLLRFLYFFYFFSSVIFYHFRIFFYCFCIMATSSIWLVSHCDI